MSGVVDGAENNEPTVFAQNHYQTPKGKVYSLTGHLIIPEIFVYSKASWDKLPKADQDLIRKLSREAQLEQRKLWERNTCDAGHYAWPLDENGEGTAQMRRDREGLLLGRRHVHADPGGLDIARRRIGRHGHGFGRD